MDDIRSFFVKIGDFLGIGPKYELTDFQKKKLLHEFHTFYDVNKDGKLQWKDFEMAREAMCRMNGWREGSGQYTFAQQMFIEIWRRLQDDADDNIDGIVTIDEWLKMWTHHHKTMMEHSKKKTGKTEEELVPPWLDKYIQYRFQLYDRTGDGEIDVDEFEYVLSMYDISPKDSRAAFLIMSENKNKKIDLAYFRELALEYYHSADQGALGNFMNGKLTFD